MKLEFSRAADAGRIAHALDPAVKGNADPHDYVAGRIKPAFNTAVASGCAVFLSDEQGRVQALTIAYHLSADSAKTGAEKHDYTELGSTLSLMPGFRSTVPVIAALALREWFNHPAARRMAADIKPVNTASVKVYQDALGWQLIRDAAEAGDINDASWRTVPDTAADPSGNTPYPAAAPGANTDWYACNDNTMPQQAAAVLAAMQQGGLVNARTGEVIPVDFSALEAEGLTRPRLEALAKGLKDKAKLRKIAP